MASHQRDDAKVNAGVGHSTHQQVVGPLAGKMLTGGGKVFKYMLVTHPVSFENGYFRSGVAGVDDEVHGGEARKTLGFTRVQSEAMSKAPTYRVLGLMSGTSLDGLDIAFVEFTLQKRWSFQLIAGETIPYSRKWEKRLSSAHALS